MLPRVLFCAVLVIVGFSAPLAAIKWHYYPDKFTCKAKAVSHDLNLGFESPLNEIEQNLTVKAQGKPEMVAQESIRFPKKGYLTDKVISRIEIKDLTPKGEAGCSFVSKGGVGHRYAIVFFFSVIGKGYAFEINIYTRRKKDETSNETVAPAMTILGDEASTEAPNGIESGQTEPQETKNDNSENLRMAPSKEHAS